MMLNAVRPIPFMTFLSSADDVPFRDMSQRARTHTLAVYSGKTAVDAATIWSMISC